MCGRVGSRGVLRVGCQPDPAHLCGLSPIIGVVLDRTVCGADGSHPSLSPSVPLTCALSAPPVVPGQRDLSQDSEYLFLSSELLRVANIAKKLSFDLV